MKVFILFETHKYFARKERFRIMDVIVIKIRQNYRNGVSPMNRMILAMYLSNNNDYVLEKLVDFENILLYSAIWNNEASSNNSILSNK